MPSVNENNIALLKLQINDLEKKNSKLIDENIGIKIIETKLREIILSLINEPSFWSPKAIDTGLINRLKKLIK